jgi:DNA-binding transcriptional regulator WhiA
MKGRPRKQFDEQYVIDKYKSGISSVALAQEVGVSSTAILGLLKRNNIPLRKSGTKLTAIPDNIDDIIRRYQAGESATEIANTIGYSHDLVEKWLKLRGIVLRGMTAYGNLDEHYFDVIDTEEKAYWLGFFAADGNVGKNNHQLQMTLAYKDLDHLKKFCQAIKSNAKIQIRERKKTLSVYKECQVCLKSKVMWEALTQKGILPEKSKNLIIPDIMEDLQRHFWRGMIDGDGSLPVSSRKYKLSLSLIGTLDVCTKFKDFVDKRFSNNSEVIKQNYKIPIYVVTIWGSSAKELIDFLYKDSTIFLDRKYLRAMEKDYVCTISNAAAECFLSENHYLKTLPIGTINYALIRDRMIVGVACVGSSSSPHPLGNVPLEFLELRRFALSQNDKNLASEFLADVIKKVRIDRPGIDGILSYADDSKGHQGIIYQAVGALYLGYSDAVSIISDDGKVFSTGRYFLDNVRKLDVDKKFSLDIIKDKHKYFIIVRKGADEKKRISDLFGDKIQPYPPKSISTSPPS